MVTILQDAYDGAHLHLLCAHLMPNHAAGVTLPRGGNDWTSAAIDSTAVSGGRGGRDDLLVELLWAHATRVWNK